MRMRDQRFANIAPACTRFKHTRGAILPIPTFTFVSATSGRARSAEDDRVPRNNPGHMAIGQIGRES